MKKEDVSHTMGAHFDLLWRKYLQTLQTHQLPATESPDITRPARTNTTPSPYPYGVSLRVVRAN